MSFSLTPLLITAALDAGKTPQVALRETHERTIKHMEGLISWLRDPDIHRIVFAKNCAARIRPELLVEIAVAYGKELEFVQTASSPRTYLQGKGYGEGDLIRLALLQSRLLRESEEFLKATGKLYMPRAVQHFNGGGNGDFLFSGRQVAGVESWRSRLLGSVYQSEKGCSLLGFLRSAMRVPWGLVAAPVRGWIDTRIYRVRRAFYEERLLTAYRRVHDSLGYTLETVFYDELRAQPAIHYIRKEPIILGTSGTLGTTAGAYSSEIQMEARELATKLLAST